MGHHRYLWQNIRQWIHFISKISHKTVPNNFIFDSIDERFPIEMKIHFSVSHAPTRTFIMFTPHRECYMSIALKWVPPATHVVGYIVCLLSAMGEGCFCACEHLPYNCRWLSLSRKNRIECRAASKFMCLRGDGGGAYKSNRKLECSNFAESRERKQMFLHVIRERWKRIRATIKRWIKHEQYSEFRKIEFIQFFIENKR